MSRQRKAWPGLVAVAVLAAILAASLWPQRSEVKVQVSRVRRQSLLSIVRATGEIIPTRYVNVLGQGYGRITRIYVHVGEIVHPGDLLLQVDPTQAASTVRADQATVASDRSALQAAQAELEGAQARVDQQKASLEKARFDWEHEEKLYQVGVISRHSVESYRTAFADAQATLRAALAQVAVARGKATSAAGRLRQAKAILAHDQDVLRKTTYSAPISGTVTNIAVRIGENVIPGVPSTPGAYLMTISKLSDAVARVRVNEDSVTSLRAGQPVTMQIDAFPSQTFSGSIQQVGAQAIQAATGMATSQLTGGSTNQQVTDYQADISITDPPKGLLPGMTVTSVIRTTRKKPVITVPFQALVLRPKDEAGRTSLPTFQPNATVQMAATTPAPGQRVGKGESGVFVVRSGRAIFTPVRVGLIGENDVEALAGVQPGEEIVVGDLNALAKLHSGMAIRITQGAQ